MLLQPISFIVPVDVKRLEVFKKWAETSIKKTTWNIEYEIVQVTNQTSGASAYNRGLEQAKYELRICCHHDFVFKPGWLERFFELLEKVEKKSNWGVLSFAGTTKEGKLVGTHSGLAMHGQEIIEVQTVDCCQLVLDEKKHLRFDEGLRFFHMYGEDMALQSWDRGLPVYVIDVPVAHMSDWTAGPGYWESVQYMRAKWGGKVGSIYTTVGTI